MTKRTACWALVALWGLAGALAAASLDPNNPTGKNGLVLIDKLGNHVRFVDPVSFQEIASLPMETAPHDLAFSPDHKTVYVPIYGDGVYGRNPHPGHTIAIIDLVSRQLTGSIDVSPYQAPHGIQVDAAGTLYVTCDLSRKLLVIDPKKRSIVAAIDTEGTGHWAAVLPDGSKAYVANKNDRMFVTVIDLHSREIIGRVPAPNGTEGIVASPDGKRVAVMDHAAPTIILIDTVNDTVADRIPLEGNTKGAFKPRYTPDGSKLVVCNLSERSVNVLNTADLHGKQTTFKVGKDPMGFAVSPDGKTLLVANHGDGTVSVVNLAEGRVVSSFMAGTGIETLSYY
ncbi:MAG TPA: YncE family protein [Bryobacteraceae bacterium]|jgi:YVTN family beta-propeller protein|nr:YncE family protein [Bryobacteraceae bacterium]